MGNKAKRIISLVAAATMASSVFALAACNAKPNSLKNPLSYTSSDDAAVSNGGFAVEKGEYVYFINGQALSTASNEYDETMKKGALLRISKENLAAGNYVTETVVPLLFVSSNTDSGIYIYGDRVYFATPTTDKDLDGNVISGLDFKSAKLDGTDVMSDYYFRAPASTQYRYVKGNDGKIYCLYVDGGALKSYSIEGRKETILVQGAASSFVFNKDQDGEDSDVVYYTMNVPNTFFGTENVSNESYTQIYRVSATATVTNFNKDTASYTVKDGDKYEKSYDFNEEYFKEVIAEEKEKQKENKVKDFEYTYDLADYTTYGYVNLGELVVDGIGASEGQFAVVSFAYIGGIFKLLGDAPELKGKEFPLVLDGPFSKLDATHRQNVIDTIPAYSPQVILFSKDDINSCFGEDGPPNVWTIYSNKGRNISTVKRGYDPDVFKANTEEQGSGSEVLA